MVGVGPLGAATASSVAGVAMDACSPSMSSSSWCMAARQLWARREGWGQLRERGGGGLRGRSGRAAAAGRGGGNGSGWGAVVGQGAYVVVTMSAGAGVNPRTGCWSSALDDTCRQATWHVGGDSGAVRHATRCGSSPSANRTRRAAPRGLSQGGLEGHRRSQRADQTEHGPQHVGPSRSRVRGAWLIH